jgi:peptide/nickel transport system permease protein
MGKYAIRRLLVLIPTFFAITMIIFLLIDVTPGDPLMQMMDPEASRTMTVEQFALKRAELGLDKPLPVRYLIWLNEAIHGNLGFSYNSRQPVVEVVLEKLANTSTLMGTAFLVALLIGIPVGIISAVKQYSMLDYVVTSISFFLMAMPAFFFAMILIYIFAVTLGWFPTGGMATLGQEKSFLDSLWYLTLPALMLGLKDAGMWARYTRSSMLEVLFQEYIVTARSKGFSERYVLYRHALPNALSPLITIFGLMLPNLIAGAVITENVFAWPGIGKLAVDAIRQRDYPVLMGVTSLTAMAVLASNFLADLLYGVADPRIRA